MLVLCLYALGVLAAESFFSTDQATRWILDTADNLVCALFFLDFLMSFFLCSEQMEIFLDVGLDRPRLRILWSMRYDGVGRLVLCGSFAC